MKIKKSIAVTVSLLMCAAMTANVEAANMSGTYKAEVYDTDGSGLALKAEPDIDSQRFTVIPEGTELKIDGVSSSGWGYTSYADYSGWVSLRYTLAISDCVAETPVTSNAITPEYNKVTETEGEGIELRARPSAESSSFGKIEEGAIVLVRAAQDGWAYVDVSKDSGWLSLEYLERWNVGKAYEVSVYGTEGSGLALKADADIDSERYLVIPEDTELTIDTVSSKGWGHTSYEDQEGWVALQYTRVNGEAAADIPGSGFARAKTYVVDGTEGEGLQLRMKATVESSTFGPIDDGKEVFVHATNGKWAYVYVDGVYGWVSLSYLKSSAPANDTEE